MKYVNAFDSRKPQSIDSAFYWRLFPRLVSVSVDAEGRHRIAGALYAPGHWSASPKI